ncbi:hypothetical protein G4B88_002423 [Cannabis sativa]|uniref:RNase H type-1 domain-containing protein n=1 Tax=Cannabis sativa TaxID=3483 RepID=A0A7J6IA61_CANSA|nr:hypothetical protein G4B88_002423 [Cannabis sativa]
MKIDGYLEEPHSFSKHQLRFFPILMWTLLLMQMVIGYKEETIGHAVWNCPSLKSVWKAAGYWHLFPTGLGMMTDLQEFLMHMEQNCSKHKFESFLGLSWMVWNQRNQRIFQNKNINLKSWTPWAMDFVDNALQQPHETIAVKEVSRPKCWVAPPRGYFSLHCDAAFGKDQQGSGIAAVIRDHEGRLVAAEVIFLEGYRSTVMAECLAIQLGLNLVQKSKARPFFVNSDSLTVINQLLSKKAPRADWGVPLPKKRHFVIE